MEIKKRALLIFSLIILLIGLVNALEISSCNDSLIEGFYELTQNITASLDSCFIFTESNIVLDCQGNLIDGNFTRLTGFEGIAVNNITIQNCIIENFLVYGIYLESSSNNELNTLEINYINTTGLYLLDVSLTNVEGVSIDNSYLDNFYLIESNNNTFNDMVITNAYDGYGIWIEDSFNNLFSGLDVRDNYYGGLTFLDFATGSYNNTVYGCTISGNGDDFEGGINLYASSGNLFYNNFLNNTLNVYIDNPADENFWNTTLSSGSNILGGVWKGGNYWATPVGDGFSETCLNSTGGICDSSYDINTDDVNVDYYPLVPYIASNNAPDDPSPNLVSVDGTNQSVSDLNCSAVINDSDGDALNVSVRWFKNNVFDFFLDYNNSYLSGAFFSSILDSGNTSEGENWSCSLRLFDGSDYSDWINSSKLFIESAPIIDDTYPLFSNYWDNNGTLTGGGRGFFNVSVENTNGTVLFEINDTNYTASNIVENVYNFSFNFSNNGTYSYRWHSWGNGSEGNFNSSAQQSYTVNPVVILPNLTITRDISNFSVLDEVFYVILEIIAQGDITALAIQEFIPEGANVSECSINSSRVVNNTLEILVFNASQNVTSLNITYNITLNKGGLFNGSWNTTVPYLSGNINHNWIQFCGDRVCNNGEDCSTCPEDCGTCSSSSSSSSSSGGSSRSSAPITTKTEQNETDTNSQTTDYETPKDKESETTNSTEDSFKDKNINDKGFFRSMGGAITDIFTNKEGKVNWFTTSVLIIITLGILVGIKAHKEEGLIFIEKIKEKLSKK